MDLKLLAWISIFCGGAILWLYIDSDRSTMNYSAHKNLFDAKTGSFKRARDVMNFTEIILAPESYSNKTNSIQRLNHLIQAMNFETPFSIDQHYSDPSMIKLAAGPNVNQTKCGQQLAWLLSQLLPSADARENSYELIPGGRGRELTALVDTFGKPDSGFYSGVVFWPGSFKGCSSLRMTMSQGDDNGARAVADDNVKVAMHYCIARFKHSAWANIRDASYPSASIRMGVCLPETCDTDSFAEYKQQIDSLAKLEMSTHFQKNLQLSSLTCLPDERSPSRQISTSARVYMTIVGSWTLLIIMVTLIYECYIRPRHLKHESETKYIVQTHEEPNSNLSKNNLSSTGTEAQFPQLATIVDLEHHEQLMMHSESHGGQLNPHSKLYNSWWLELIEGLSIRHSLKSFKFNAFRVRHHRGERVRVNLSPLDSIKIGMALLVILGHSSLISVIYSRSMRNKIDLSTSEPGRLALSVARCVDTYFVFFGLLTSFTLLRKLKPHQLANPFIWLTINVAVFLRVGPIFMLVYWFSRSVMPNLGSGPWWDYGFIDDMSMRTICMHEPWWKSIPYFGHIGIPEVPACLLPGWFIVSYVQLSLVMPLITYILFNLNGQLKRIVFVSFLSTVSCACLAIRAYQQTAISPEGVSLYGSMAFNLLEKYEPSGYLTSLSRLGSVAVGSLIGCLLHFYDLGQIKEWPRWLINKYLFYVSLIGVILIIWLPVIGHKIYLATGKLPTLNEFVITSSICSFIFPLILTFLVINLATENNRNVIVRFMGHSFWHIFNRLGLLIFLIHWEILVYGATSFENAPSYGFITDVIKIWAFGSFMSILLAFVLYIMIEAPLGRLCVLATKPLIALQTKCNNSATQMEKETNPNSDPNSSNLVKIISTESRSRK